MDDQRALYPAEYETPVFPTTSGSFDEREREMLE
jgi:hypothetical protein